VITRIAKLAKECQDCVRLFNSGNVWQFRRFWQSDVTFGHCKPCGIAIPSAYMPKDFVCAVCDLPERKCQCERYCVLCQSLHEVRLCEDGQYYCQPCREACDLEAQYQAKE